MGITFGGFATGLDTNAIIEAFVNAEKIPRDRLAEQKNAVEAATQTVSNLATKLSSLREAAAALGDPTKFTAMGVTSSDTAVVATATVGAAAGRYDVVVTQLAKEERTYSNTQTSGTDALGFAGTLSLQVGTGTAVDLDVLATDSLSAIASKINGAGQKMSASVIYDGTTYRLSIRGTETGAANSLTFGGAAGTALGLDLSGNQAQAAQNATLTVDGLAITRPTNQVSGVIQGVTLALTKVTTTPATVQVSSDPAALKTKITSFVTAYNDVVLLEQTAAGLGAQKAANSALSGDSMIRGVLDRLSRTVGSAVAGTSGKYTTLMSVGIASTKEGQLRFDETKLAEALTTDPTGVAKLFTKDANLGSTGAFESFKTTLDLLNGTTKSPVRARIEALQKQAVRMTETMDAMDRRLDNYTTMLRKQFSELEASVSKFQSSGNAASASFSSISGSGSK